MSQPRREFGEVPATPVSVDAGDDELNAIKSVDEVAHRACEVSLVGRRVTELHFVGGQHVASPYTDTDAHVGNPPRRPRRRHELVDELTNFRPESEVPAQPALDVECVFPALEEPGQEDGLVACFSRKTAVGQLLHATVVQQRPTFAECVARTEVIEALDAEIEDLIER